MWIISRQKSWLLSPMTDFLASHLNSYLGKIYVKLLSWKDIYLLKKTCAEVPSEPKTYHIWNLNLELKTNPIRHNLFTFLTQIPKLLSEVKPISVEVEWVPVVVGALFKMIGTPVVCQSLLK